MYSSPLASRHSASISKVTRLFNLVPLYEPFQLAYIDTYVGSDYLTVGPDSWQEDRAFQQAFLNASEYISSVSFPFSSLTIFSCCTPTHTHTHLQLQQLSTLMTKYGEDPEFKKVLKESTEKQKKNFEEAGLVSMQAGV